MTNNTLRIMCPNLTCRKVLTVPQSARGKTVRCKACGTTVLVPQPASAKSSPEKEKKAG